MRRDQECQIDCHPERQNGRDTHQGTRSGPQPSPESPWAGSLQICLRDESAWLETWSLVSATQLWPALRPGGKFESPALACHRVRSNVVPGSRRGRSVRLAQRARAPGPGDFASRLLLPILDFVFPSGHRIPIRATDQNTLFILLDRTRNANELRHPKSENDRAST